ncbi:MAG: hypothetical protein M1281_12925, partial [Chloroflexi bacterium]|nr:hypothetical protein [Chloroflexota bacterium]
MKYRDLVKIIADLLKEFDEERPRHKDFKPGIGPFGEPQIVSTIANRLQNKGYVARTRRTPDLEIGNEWAIEFKIVRPFGDNGKEAENWTVNMLHPYPGNVSLIGDALKLIQLSGYTHKGLFVIGYEHDPAKIKLDPLILSFELIARQVMNINLGQRVEEIRGILVHPEHQVVRCLAGNYFLKAFREERSRIYSISLPNSPPKLAISSAVPGLSGSPCHAVGLSTTQPDVA